MKRIDLSRASWKKFALFFALCGFCHMLYAQQGVNLQLQDVTVTEALKKMNVATGYEFFYNSTQLAKCTKRVNAHFQDTPLPQALQEILSGTDFTFKEENQTIVILHRSTSEEKGEPEKTEVKVHGKVMDASDRSPMAGVTVVIGESFGGTATDADGEFTLMLPGNGCDVTFSFIGYEPLVIHFNGKDVSTLAEILLQETLTEINEVVVTGVYQRKKESFTGSSTTFKGDELKKVGSQNVLQSLKTLDPSFKIIENNQFGSNPNRMPDIEIRGKSSVMGLKEEYGTDPNQPLFILDGFETTLET
ncbi:MAG: carboxypeptidase-like regulatory domain-containing protein, partial [Odoribacter sp.]|nr:carboxypeptidase-like regulatory domain-containing protein [Odoribacter sp.]